MPAFVTVPVEDLAAVLALADRPPVAGDRGPIRRLQERLDSAPRSGQLEQLPLGGEPGGNLAAMTAPHRHPDHATSVAAAQHVTLTAGTLRVRALLALARAGRDGLTDVELEEALEVRRPTGGNRRGELAKAGLVQPRHEPAEGGERVTREVPGHLPATVWQITVAGRKALEDLGYRTEHVTTGSGSWWILATPTADVRTADRPTRITVPTVD